MPRIQLKRFLHTPTAANMLLVESQCKDCGNLIAAGTQDKYLAIAELAHHCSHDSLAQVE